MNILIFGASGLTGHHLVKLALMTGHTVTAFVRNPVKLKIEHAQLKIVCGNVINYELVEKTVTGKEAVISALGAGNPFKYDQSVVDGIKNIIKAMEINKVSRFIYMSTMGVEGSRNQAGFIIKFIAPKLLTTEIAGHQAREKMIRQSRLRWTIVRPPILTNGQHVGQWRHGETIHSKGFKVSISRADVADFMIRQLTDDSFIKKSPAIMY